MKHKKIAFNSIAILMIIGVTFFCLFVSSSNAALLTFDDVPGGSTQSNVGNMPTYQGFNFSFTLDWIDTVGSAWNFGAHSGDFSLLNNNGGVGTITEANGTDFTFDGLWAKKWNISPNSGGADSLFGTLSGYNNGNLVWDVSTGLDGSYEYYGSQAGAIDELRLGFGNHFLVDDIALNEVSDVPEPSTVLLLGFSLVGLIGYNYRRQKQAV